MPVEEFNLTKGKEVSSPPTQPFPSRPSRISLKSKHRNAIREHIHIVAVIRQTDAIPLYHALRSHGVEIVDIHVSCVGAFDAQ